MAELPRLNNVIKALEAGKASFTSFCQADPETFDRLAEVRRITRDRQRRAG